MSKTFLCSLASNLIDDKKYRESAGNKETAGLLQPAA